MRLLLYFSINLRYTLTDSHVTRHNRFYSRFLKIVISLLFTTRNILEECRSCCVAAAMEAA